jgi:hypothetical protein
VNKRHSAVLIFANFGFYHLARMHALAELFPVTGIELAAEALWLACEQYRIQDSHTP